MYVFELCQKFPRHVFHVDHLLNEGSGRPRAKGIEDLKDGGERCIVSLCFGFSPSSPFDVHTRSFSCLQYLHFLLKHVCQAITFVTQPFLEKAICLLSCIDDLIFNVRSIWRPSQINLSAWGLDSWRINASWILWDAIFKGVLRLLSFFLYDHQFFNISCTRYV